jgi:cation diffusion facilitator family transporter
MAHPADTADAAHHRERWLRRGRRLALVSVAWTVIEAAGSLWAGLAADSIALLGFGIDSVIETLSACLVVWRLSAESRGDAARGRRAETLAGRWSAVLLALLAAYIGVESLRRLLGYGPEAGTSPAGMAFMAVAVAVMAALYAAKRRVARELNSATVRADGIQSLACCWLGVATFVGLALHALLGWSWADPAAGLALIPIIVKEAREAWKGEGCGCGG